MTSFFRATLLYVTAAVLLTGWLHDDILQALRDAAGFASGYLRSFGASAVYILPVLLPLAFLYRRHISLDRLRSVFLVAIAYTLMQAGFLFFKSAIPQLVPFYADPWLAGVEHRLLFGHDAWQLAHAVTPDRLAVWFPQIYLTLWSALACAFPILVPATDPDPARRDRYLWLLLLSWLVLGNLLATAGSSVGPVYYDLVYGTDRFAGLHQAFAAGGFDTGPIARLQALLWESSTGNISYISAFPSMHVAMACIAALYLRERFPRFQVLGHGFGALILLISIYSGYHYLLDGLVSLFAVLALDAALRRHQALAGAAPGRRALAPWRLPLRLARTPGLDAPTQGR